MLEKIEVVRQLLGGSARAGATLSEVASEERRLRVQLPDDLRLLVTSFDGSDENTPIDNGWVTFWPMRNWRPVSDEPNASGGSSIPQALLFADHGIESWWYALDVHPSSTTWSVYLVDGVGPDTLVAGSVSDFLQAIIDDSRALYRRRLQE